MLSPGLLSPGNGFVAGRQTVAIVDEALDMIWPRDGKGASSKLRPRPDCDSRPGGG